jgi:hypothetical protein
MVAAAAATMRMTQSPTRLRFWAVCFDTVWARRF